jgi:hypothetical protein
MLLGVLVAVLFVIGNWFAWDWYNDKLTALNHSAANLEDEQASAQDALKELPDWKSKLDWIKSTQPPLGSEGDAKAAVLDFVEKGATAHKLQIIEQSLNDVEQTAGGTRVSASVKVKGSMKDLAEWLAPLNKPDDFYAVTHFELQADQDQKSFDCTLQISRYFKGGTS